MLLLKVILALLSAAFLTFGYLICVRRRYHLINDFQEAQRAGRRDEAYAQKVGRIELYVGFALLLILIVLIIAA